VAGLADPILEKGKVERGVGHAKKHSPQRGCALKLEEAQAYLDRWEANWADTRIHGRPSTGGAMFSPKRNRPCCRLPIEPFRYYRSGNAE